MREMKSASEEGINVEKLWERWNLPFSENDKSEQEMEFSNYSCSSIKTLKMLGWSAGNELSRLIVHS